MKRLLPNIFLFILACHVCVCEAQYAGGISDGHSVGSVIISACPPKPNTAIYRGGNASNNTSGIYTISACAPVVNTNIYNGGNSGGYSSGTFIAATCPPLPSTNIYLGGNASGYSRAAITATVCPPLPSTNIYYGGNASGYARAALTATVCPPLPSTNIYYGGNASGYVRAALITTVCPPFANTNIYTGGNADGFGINSFTACIVVLPIELLSFAGTCHDQSTILKWASATETDNDYYTPERAHEGMNWQPIGTVNGAGTSVSTHYYSFIDTKPYRDISYYRLKQTGRDGKYSYSGVVTVSCSDGPAGILILPNPNNGHFVIEGAEKNSDLIITNPLGAVILKAKVSLDKVEMDLSGQANGVYFLEINSAYKTSVQKIIVNK